MDKSCNRFRLERVYSCKKNWLFSGSLRGAYASAAIYSLAETAKVNNLEPYRYLRYVFERKPVVESRNDYYRLFPQNIDGL